MNGEQRPNTQEPPTIVGLEAIDDDRELRADNLRCSCLSKSQKRRHILLCCTSAEVRNCPIHEEIPKNIMSKGNAYAVEEADSFNECFLTVDSETTDITIFDTTDKTVIDTTDTTVVETSDSNILKTLSADDHTYVDETNKTIASDLRSTESRLNSELSFIDMWSAALTSVYGAETNDAGSKDEQESSSRKIDNESIGTKVDNNDPIASLQNQPDQHTFGEVTETKSQTDSKEKEPNALTVATDINQQMQQPNSSSPENSEGENYKPAAAIADDRSSGDAVPREKADTEVRLIQTLKELCSVVFSKNGKIKKAKSDIQQKEFKQKGARGRPKELEHDSGIAISDTSEYSGKEITKEITNIPGSFGGNDGQMESNHDNASMKISSAKELVQTENAPMEAVDKIKRDHGGTPNIDYKSHSDTGAEKDISSSSSKGTKDELSGDDLSSDTHFLINMSNSEDDIDCDIDINDAYDMYIVHEAARYRSKSKEKKCQKLKDAKQDIQNNDETEMKTRNSNEHIDNVSDKCFTKDTKRIAHSITNGSPATKKNSNGLSNIPRPEKNQINNIKRQIKGIKQNLKELPSSTVEEKNQASMKQLSCNSAEDVYKQGAVFKASGMDNLEHMTAKKMTANLVVPLPFRNQFLLDNCRVKTFKTDSKDKSKMMVELDIDYRIDSAEHFKDHKQKQSSGEIYKDGVVVKNTDIEGLQFGLGARPKEATNMHRHLNQHETPAEDIEGSQQRKAQHAQGSPSGYRRHKKKSKRKPRWN